MGCTKIALAVIFIALVDQITLYLQSVAAQPFYTSKDYFFIWGSTWLPWNQTAESFILPLAFSLAKGLIFTFAYLSFKLRKGKFSALRFLSILILLSVALPFFLVFIMFSIPPAFIFLLSIQQAATCAAAVFILRQVIE
ncbi:MAG: hypothetical protein QXT25_03790 [Candidatus Anstonellaceae archaeon]